MQFNRRQMLGGAAAGVTSLALPSIVRAQAASAHVVVIGGGFGGATAARYLRQLAPQLRVTLVEPAARFYTCPFSNLYLAGLRSWESIGHSYDGLRKAGVHVVHARADHVLTDTRRVLLSNGQALSYDKLVLSPGVDMRWNALEGYDEAASQLAPHAWKAGPQTQLLKKQLEAMPDGGKFVMVIPANPFRCPPGPYERAAMVAHYLKQHKPKSKILLLDDKDAFSKQGLFIQGWKALYGDMIEWVKQSDDGKVTRADAKNLEVETAFGTKHKADVLNVIPPQKAGFIADRAGVTDASGWVPVKAESFESSKVPNVYVLGDATIAAPMPKSGFAANTQGKVAAAAIAAELTGQPLPAASYANTCYSLIGNDYGISVAGVYRAQEGKLIEVPNSGGVSPLDGNAAFRKAEADYGSAWYKAISTDIWDR
ncbi:MULTISPECIES: NAD(P)/FAD-dependent oxidoreductase [Comamonas]|uniref:Cytochrome C n=1 Tax=Comamonas terrigena TaxID=32013 RepID=A0A2A7UTR1_COMTR|nr:MULTISPECIES: NAD(P)/FAD-dependent oxidoreductase [Comamonas]MBD9532386.1 FAD-dependent oxidoreductase [Comamonas sp. CMM01]PEH88571.1 cytochrome C [Comamonas terrigena]BBL23579.1 cytochrome c [Comamonas terrigena NBRC 13299]SUY88135.1 Sulfide dehydrogenase [flavocytochrome c] flavoprotein chain precursor [Comamonas terrigena]